MAHALKLEVVAEGVESADQGHWLIENGCQLLQGFYYGRPALACDWDRKEWILPAGM